MDKITTIVFLSLNCFVIFGQSNCEKCKEIFKNGDFVKAKDECLKASQDGDPICQAYLGIIYLEDSDTYNAKIWFEKSATQGNPIGQNGLGYLYQNGFGGLSKNIDKANEWFLKSAEQNNSDSQFWLGENLFLSGNKTEGYKWTLRASLNGSSDAQFNLGAILYNGEGTEENDSLAIIWFIISATNGNEKSKNFVDDLKLKLPDDEFQNYIKMTQDYVNKNPQVIN
jgi:TPR repeat protein